MNEQDGKNIIVPIETEIERLMRVLSEKEKRSNPRMMGKMKKVKQKLSILRELLAPTRLQSEGEY